MATEEIMLGVRVPVALARRIDLAIANMKSELGPGFRITRSDIVRQALELTVPTISAPKVRVRVRSRTPQPSA